MPPSRLFLRHLGRQPLLLPTYFRSTLISFQAKSLSNYSRFQKREASNSTRTQASTPPSASSKGKGKGKGVSGVQDEVVEAMEEELDRLPFLQRPLGVREPPSTEPKSWKDEMMNQEVRMDHRRKLYGSSSLSLHLFFSTPLISCHAL